MSIPMVSHPQTQVRGNLQCRRFVCWRTGLYHEEFARQASYALCDITHAGISRKKEFDEVCYKANIEWELLHRDEATIQQLAAAGDLAAVIQKVGLGEGWTRILGPLELQECGGDPAKLVEKLQRVVVTRNEMGPNKTDKTPAAAVAPTTG